MKRFEKYETEKRFEMYKTDVVRVWLQHGQLHIQSILRASLGRLHRTLRASETICFVDLTQDGRGTLKTMFVIEMDSEETQMTRLGMVLSQSCAQG